MGILHINLTVTCGAGTGTLPVVVSVGSLASGPRGPDGEPVNRMRPGAHVPLCALGRPEPNQDENHKMKLINIAALLALGIPAFAQDVQFDYNRSANFNAYKTYQWIDYRPVQPGDELLDQDIKRAVDEQLAGKSLRRVESGGDLIVGYKAGISQEKAFDSLGSGWGPGWWGGWGNTRVTTSTIDVGKLVIGLFDPTTKQLVWRGAASKTLNISKDPDKNYRILEKAMAKLFKNYPPGAAKR